MIKMDELQGARNTETGLYRVVHEDFEYRATPQFAIFIIKLLREWGGGR